ncbi:hypothetical protein Trydic_g1320 [Trypoxylus dichotomus]
MLVSFGVTSPFIQVHINETVDIIKNKQKVEDLIEHCLKNIYFTYNGHKYRQTEGAPMGSPVSHIIANIIMEDIETMVLNTSKYRPKLWLSYVDDTFIICTYSEDKLQDLLLHLNSIHPKIKSTTGIEYPNQLPFLNILVIKKRDGTLGHTVYRKATHSNY